MTMSAKVLETKIYPLAKVIFTIKIEYTDLHNALTEKHPLWLSLYIEWLSVKFLAISVSSCTLMSTKLLDLHCKRLLYWLFCILLFVTSLAHWGITNNIPWYLHLEIFGHLWRILCKFVYKAWLIKVTFLFSSCERLGYEWYVIPAATSCAACRWLIILNADFQRGL